ncbi:sulfotransferase domain-containing protein [Ectobacillus ponti]|uniref:Sulfotransferase domain-containing protein n=1 Tax=Ectobacillus ponti TaxID=2961894 RepID=A0AA42BNT3_9BACI|nr:sulfotransferase domain-containing protein [Ectobacillus ponti]MCP8968335.1 sulfotransferase domain-containing protein [Ectobacillus ponti]
MLKQQSLPKICVNSVPKSGTHLVMQLMEGIPGIYKERILGGAHTAEILALKPGEMASCHISYSPDYSKELQQHAIKQIFVYRDLRDVAVSLLHFIHRQMNEHPLFQVFQNRSQTFEEQLNTIILGTELKGAERNNLWGLTYYPGIYKEFGPIYRWRTDPSVCSVRFEELNGSPLAREAAIYRMVDYLWDSLGSLQLSKQEIAESMKRNVDPEKSWTFRKGKIGSWHEEFTEENKQNFKRVAGDFLIELGYEKDHSW